MATPAAQATLVRLNGHVFIRDAAGHVTELKPGDVIHQDQVLVTDPGSDAALLMPNGTTQDIGPDRSVLLDAQFLGMTPVDTVDAALKSLDQSAAAQVSQIIAQGGDLSTQLESAAAGLGGGGADAGANSGHTFIQLTRIDESAGGVSFDFNGGAGPSANGLALNTVTGQPNQAPTAVNDNAVPDAEGDKLTTPEDTPLSIAPIVLLANDSDPDGDTLTIVSVQGATHGTVALDTTGHVIFTPDANFNGAASFTYTISDGHGNTSTATVDLIVTPVNDVATVTNDAGVVKEDTPAQTVASGHVVVTDADVGQAVAIPNTVTNDYGTFHVDANGDWTFTINNASPIVQALAAGDSVPLTFDVTSVDGTGHGTVSITVLGTNDIATVTNDAGVVKEDTPTEAVASGHVIVTDVDHDQAALIPTTVTNDYGTFTAHADGTWSFTINNGSPVVQALAEGDSVPLSFDVTSVDGTGHGTVSITVLGTNDIAVVGQGADDVGSGVVKEDTPAETVASGHLTVTDVDHGQAALIPTTVTNDYGTFTAHADGSWSFTINNASPLVQQLGADESTSFSFPVTSVDGTGHGTVSITVLGTNDVPVISGEHIGAVTEDNGAPDADDFQPTLFEGEGPFLPPPTPAPITVSGQLTETDVDIHDTHSWSVVGPDHATYGSFSVDDTGKWTFVLDNNAAQALAQDEKATETFTVQVDDHHGGIATQDVTITITGVNDIAVVGHGKDDVGFGVVKEDTPDQSVANGHLTVTDPDHGQSLLVPQSVTNDYGTFHADANGDWSFTINNDSSLVQQLGADESTSFSFPVTSVDGTGHGFVTVTVLGTNDVPVISGEHTGAVTEDNGAPDADDFKPTLFEGEGEGQFVPPPTPAPITVSGQLTETDVDIHDTHSWSVVGPDHATYGSFSVDDTGKWTFLLDNNAAQALAQDEKATETFTVQVDDHHGGIATQDVTITITGVNDIAVVGQGSEDVGSGVVKEDTPEQSVANGHLTVTDLDHGQSALTPTTVTNDYGTFHADANGDWSFTINNDSSLVQQLGADESTSFSFPVTSVDGTGHGSVEITVLGTNDVPVISGEHTGAVTEDNGAPDADDFQPTLFEGEGQFLPPPTPAPITVSGQLTETDVDIHDTHSWSVVGPDHATYGSFSVDDTGKWTFLLDNNAAQALAQDEKATETFTVQVDDHHGGIATQDVSITITGVNDIAVVGQGSEDVGSGVVKEDTPDQSVANGHLTVTDLDHGQSLLVPQTVTNDYGTFHADANGDWTFTINNDSPQVQALAENDSASLHFDVTSVDGTGHSTVDITVLGTSDVSTVSDDSGVVTEDTPAETVATGQVFVTDDEHAELALTPTTVTNDYGTFTANADGTWSFTLNNDSPQVQALTSEDSVALNFDVTSVDGTGHGTVSITVQGISDVSAVSNDSGVVTEDTPAETVATGHVVVTDDEQAESALTPTTVTNDYGTFTANADGTWSFTLNNDSAVVQALTSEDSVALNFDVTSVDGTGHGTVSITVQGSSDVSTVSSDSGVVREDSSNGDKEGGDDEGKDGSDEGDKDGNSEGDKGGADDDNVGSSAGLVATGHVTVTDDEHAEAALTPTTVTNEYGTFVANADGTWRFTLNDSSPTVEALGTGASVLLHFAVTSVDGSGHGVVDITVLGTSDAPVVQAESNVTLSEEALPHGNPDTPADATDVAVMSGHFAITDVDSTTFSLKFAAPSSALTSGGEAIVWSGAGTGVLIGTAHGQEVIHIAQTDTHGGYQVTLGGPIDQPAGTEVTTSFAVGVTVDDGMNNPTATSTLTVNVEDDAPVAMITNGLVQNTADTVLAGTLASIGADNIGAHVTLSGTPPTGLTSEGDAVTYSLSADHSVLTAKAGEDTVFTLSALADGTYLFDQSRLLDLSVVSSGLQADVHAGGPEPAYYVYLDGSFGSVESAKDWVVKITGSDEINPSAQGIGVGNNLFQTGETMHLKFDATGASTVGHGIPDLMYAAKIGVADVGEHSDWTVTWTAHFTDGSATSGTVTAASLDHGTFKITSPTGLFLDHVDLSAGADTSVRINSLTTYLYDDAHARDLPFAFTAHDGDGDSTTGVFHITEQNAGLLVGDSTHTALAGGGHDTLIGSAANDILIGGEGDETLTGGLGANVFKWLPDDHTSVTPPKDTVTDFHSSQHDALDLRDLLTGVNWANTNHEALATVLDNYLHLTENGAGTTVTVKAGGTSVTQVIVLQGVADLIDTGHDTSHAAIKYMLDNDLLKHG